MTFDRLSRALASVALAAGVAFAGASPALASWSPPRTFAGHVEAYFSTAGPAALATNSRGDTVLAWHTQRQVGRAPHWWYDSSLQVAFGQRRRAIVAHVVWRRSHALAAGVTVVLDARGELTVAWIEEPSSSNGPHVVRSVRRTPAGRWTAPQTIGRSVAFYDATPKLAVAPDGRVLLSWYAGSSAGVRAAWRSPGRPFVAASTVTRTAITDPTPAFDAGGGAHVYGIVRCDSRAAHGVVLDSRSGSRRFGAPVLVAPAPASELAISYAGRGRALAAWQRSECSTLEPSPGAAAARAMVNGAWRRPYVPDPRATAAEVTPVAAGAGGGTVGWVNQPYAPAPPVVLSMTADTSGAFSAPAAPAGRLAAVARDAAGDVVIEDLLARRELSEARTSPGGPGSPSPVAMLAAGAATDEPSPMSPFTGTPLALSLSGVAVAMPVTGRGAAIAWQAGASARVTIATWRP